MTKGSPDYKKRLVSIKGARVAPSSIKDDLVTLGGKAKNATEKDLVTRLANDVNGVKGVNNQMTIG
jgi:osmotically-inducible protein OsmY